MYIHKPCGNQKLKIYRRCTQRNEKGSRHNSKGSHQITLKENKINRMELSMNYKTTHEQLTKSQ